MNNLKTTTVVSIALNLILFILLGVFMFHYVNFRYEVMLNQHSSTVSFREVWNRLEVLENKEVN